MLKCEENKIYSWQNSLDFVCRRFFLDKKQVSAGSIPEGTLNLICQTVRGNGLQIGGFVGLTHCFFANYFRNTKNFICTVDSNERHRKIDNPFLIMKSAIDYYNLKSNSMSICGYGLQQMDIFEKLGLKFDYIILDGNHDLSNVVEEITIANKILNIGGHIIIDDIDHWEGPKSAYNFLHLKNYEKINISKRAGIIKKVSK